MLNKLGKFFELIKFEHTVFALPFAYMGMIMARPGMPGWRTFAWTTLAMVGARTAGMTLNRIIDVKIDAQNPRTSSRPSVTGEFPLPWAWAVAALSLGLFFASAAMLNPLCLKLSPVALALLCSYHYVKRFSRYCHFALGLVLALAPMGGWIAQSGTFGWQPIFLALAVLFWVAGFDIIYSLQDVEFDRANKLHSFCVHYGAKRAVQMAAYCHVATVAFLALFGLVMGLGVVYYAGVAVTAALLKVEHFIVSEADAKNIQTAFFTINGWIGILLLIFTFLEIFK